MASSTSYRAPPDGELDTFTRGTDGMRPQSDGYKIGSA